MADLNVGFSNSKENAVYFDIRINGVPITGLTSIDLHCDVLDGERKCTFKMEGDLAPFLSTVDKLMEKAVQESKTVPAQVEEVSVEINNLPEIITMAEKAEKQTFELLETAQELEKIKLNLELS